MTERGSGWSQYLEFEGAANTEPASTPVALARSLGYMARASGAPHVRRHWFGRQKLTVPDPTAPRSDHAYTYRIVGDGSPLTVAVLDDAHSDNTGRLRVTIRRSQ